MLKMSFAGLALVAALAGCGGKVIFDTSAAGTGSGGATTTGVGVTNGVGVGTSAHTGATVTSSTKASTGFASTTVGSSKAASTSSGFAPSCNNFGFQGIGSSCNQPGVECEVAHACCYEHAVCENGTWQPSPNGPFCNHPCIQCGPSPFGCDPNNVCVDHNFGGNHTFTCAHDPCPQGQLNCGCAQFICQQGGAGMDCATTTQNTVTCVPQL